MTILLVHRTRYGIEFHRLLQSELRHAGVARADVDGRARTDASARDVDGQASELASTNQSCASHTGACSSYWWLYIVVYMSAEEKTTSGDVQMRSASSLRHLAVHSGALPEQVVQIRPRAGRPAARAAAHRDHCCERAVQMQITTGRLPFILHIYSIIQSSEAAARVCMRCADALNWSALRRAHAWAGRLIEPVRRSATASRTNYHCCSAHISRWLLKSI